MKASAKAAFSHFAGDRVVSGTTETLQQSVAKNYPVDARNDPSQAVRRNKPSLARPVGGAVTDPRRD